MKKFITYSKTLAALLMASATFVACTNDDNIIDEPRQPANGKYTMTIEATKGGATTRALSLSGKTLNATWATTENVYVQKGSDWATGSLQPQTDGETATLKGDLSDITIEASDNLTLQFPRSGALDYTGQVGTLADIAANFDYATATVEVASVSGGNITPVDATTTFTNQQAIVKFTLIDKADGTTPLSATQLIVSDGTNSYTITPASATSEIYVAIPGFSGQTVTLEASVAGRLYTYSKNSVTFANGQYYEITVKMTAVPGTLSGLFTINASGDQVRFSQGNLQATTTDSWTTWTFSFMEHQYSMVETNADPYCTANYGDKTVVSLFGWGTSGYEHRTYYWQPYSTKNDSYYVAYYSAYYDLNQAGQSGQADWGYNAISNGGNTENSGWRTMTSDEWSYLLTNHTKGWATVSGVSGLVIRPDGVSTAVASTYTAEAWAAEEAAGAVFLPAAGVRVGNTDTENKSYVVSVGSKAFYWTATHYDNGTHNAYRTNIDAYTTEVTNNANPACGNAVRLVKDAN